MIRFLDKRLYWYLKSQLLYRWIFKSFGYYSYLGTPLFLKNTKKIEIKNKVRIFPGARIELYNKNSKLIINENISIGHNLHLICGGEIIIGKNTTIASNVFINDMDNDYSELGKSIMEQKQIIKRTRIGENCFIGFSSSIQAGTILGNNVIVGSNSFVKGKYPDNCVIGGVPAKILKRYNFETNEWK